MIKGKIVIGIIIDIILFILALLAVVILDGAASLMLGLIFGLIWLGFTAWLIISSLRPDEPEEKDIIDKMFESARTSRFRGYAEDLKIQYDSVISREQYFKEFTKGDGGIMDAYYSIKEEVIGNIENATEYMQSYDYYTNPEPVYLTMLCRNGDVVIRKFNELVQQMVVLNDESKVDIKYVDDLIQSLSDVKADELESLRQRYENAEDYSFEEGRGKRG